MPLLDKHLEKKIHASLTKLEIQIDAVGPTPVRHKLSELIVEMRRTLWDFDQEKCESLLQGEVK